MLTMKAGAHRSQVLHILLNNPWRRRHRTGRIVVDDLRGQEFILDQHKERPMGCPSPARSESRPELCVGWCFDECFVLAVDLDPAPPGLRDVDAVLAVYRNANRTVEPAYQRSRVDTGIRLPGVVC